MLMDTEFHPKGRAAMRSVLVTAAILFAGHTAADILRVDPRVPSGGDGSNWNRAYNSLHNALAAAVPGDEIWVVQGTYTPTIPAGRDATFLVPAGVQIYGGFQGGETSRTQRDFEDNPTELSGAGSV